MTVLWLFLEYSNSIFQVSHAKPLKRGILGASTIILSTDIDKYAFMSGSNFNETDVIWKKVDLSTSYVTNPLN